MKIEIINANAADELIDKLGKFCFEEEMYYYICGFIKQFLPENRSSKKGKESLKDIRHIVYAYLDEEGFVIAALHCYYTEYKGRAYNNQCELFDLYVSKLQRNKGIAKELIECAIEKILASDDLQVKKISVHFSTDGDNNVLSARKKIRFFFCDTMKVKYPNIVFDLT